MPLISSIAVFIPANIVSEVTVVSASNGVTAGRIRPVVAPLYLAATTVSSWSVTYMVYVATR